MHRIDELAMVRAMRSAYRASAEVIRKEPMEILEKGVIPGSLAIGFILAVTLGLALLSN